MHMRSKKNGFNKVRVSRVLNLTLVIIAIVSACGRPKGTKAVALKHQSPGCQNNCQTPSVQSFSFTEKMIGIDKNCKYQAAEIFDSGTALQFFLLAECGTNTQLYTMDSDYTLTTFSDLKLVSKECEASGGTIMNAKVGRGSATFMAIHSCDVFGSPRQLRTTAVTLGSGVASGTLLSSDTDNSEFSAFSKLGQVVWNESAGLFLIYARQTIWFVSSFGSLVGGRLWPAGGRIGEEGIVVLNNNDWSILAQRGCNRVTSKRILSCQKFEASGGHSSLWEGAVVKGEFSYFDIRALDKDQCGTTSVVQLRFSEESHSHPLVSIKINPLHYALAYQDNEAPSNLRLGMLKKAAKPELAWTIPIAEKVSLSFNSIALASNKLFAAFVREGLLYVAVTDQNIN